ncbi:MAG: hypothetical protein F6K10_00265 [Moorea sp. SIO2B7]|nr:hypothetical protein [Moorena sp. SIO2B7]
MNLSLLSAKIFGKKRFPLLLLTLILSVGGLLAKAQSQEVWPSTTLIAQSHADSNEVEQKAEEFIDLLASRKFAEARELLHPNLKTSISAEELEQKSSLRNVLKSC